MPTAPKSSRLLALRVLRAWDAAGGSAFAEALLDGALRGAKPAMGSSDRALAHAIVFGVIRHRTLLDYWIDRLLSKRDTDSDTRRILEIGLVQALILHVPSHAAVNETVDLAPKNRRGLVNAILRRAEREREQLGQAAERAPAEVRYSHPSFLVERWTAQFGADAAASLMAWNNEPAPVIARVNQLKTPSAEVEAILRSARPAAAGANSRFQFIEIESIDPRLVGSGAIYIQDPSTAIAPELLSPAPGERVLDACAAPGGKSAMLAEMMRNTGEIVAADQKPRRLQRVAENFHRLGVAIAAAVPVDWSIPSPLGDVPSHVLDRPFDAALVDVPCSNTGVLRRRVDARWRLSPQALEEKLPKLQLAILTAVSKLVRPDGRLVYSTCSIEPEENDKVVDTFLKGHAEFRLADTKASLPHIDGIDGAFAALMVRK